MLLGESELILETFSDVYVRDVPVTLAVLKGGKVLAISKDTLALYKDRDSLDDPLGGGLINMMAIPEYACCSDGPPTITHYRSGFVALSDGKVLFITPTAFRLYADKDDALRNNSLICELRHVD